MFMTTNRNSDIEKLIIEFLEQKQKSLYHHKKKSDAEKEYNKLLAISGGEDKQFSLEEADKIYKAYQDMLINEEQCKLAEDRFNESYEKLKTLGQVLFHGSITADVIIPPVNGGGPVAKQVTVTFPNGEVCVG